MKCLVTGGAGFIGSHLAEALVKANHEVRVLDDGSGWISGLENNREIIESKNIEIRGGSITDPDTINSAVQGIDFIFHQAALRSVSRSIENPFSTNEINVGGTLRLLVAAEKAKVKRVVYASSSSAYGNQQNYPLKEDLIPSPISPYAVSKLAAEQYCMVYWNTFKLETVALRYFNVFGPRQSPKSQYAAVIPIFMQRALEGKPIEVHSDGDQSRDFTYIDNVVEANILAATMPNAAGKVFNIATGNCYSLKDVIAEIEKLSGRKLECKYGPQRAGDVRKTLADIKKAKDILGYTIKVNFEEGMKKTWEWAVDEWKKNK